MILFLLVILRQLRHSERYVVEFPEAGLCRLRTINSELNGSTLDLWGCYRGLDSTVQLRIDSYQPAQSCSWKFYNIAYATVTLHQIQKWWNLTHPTTSLSCFSSFVFINKSVFRVLQTLVSLTSVLLCSIKKSLWQLDKYERAPNFIQST